MLIPFYKFSSQGNHFVVIDETQREIVEERNKPTFSEIISDQAFGIGCDNVLFIQELNSKNISEILEFRQYQWDEQVIEFFAHEIASSKHNLYIFRMFESDGQEASMCGNGLGSVFNLIKSNVGTQASFLTEVPTRFPKFRKVRKGVAQNSFEIEMGAIRKPQNDPHFTLNKEPQVMKSITEASALNRWFQSQLDEYLLLHPYFAFGEAFFTEFDSYFHVDYIYSGEPHIVIFPIKSIDSIDTIFPFFSAGNLTTSGLIINSLGKFLNSKRKIFPHGINICFAQTLEVKNSVIMRSFERGILHETHACGTGAIAVAAALTSKKIIDPSDSLKIYPYLAMLKKTEGYTINYSVDGWILSGVSNMVFKGEINFDFEKGGMV